MLYTFTDLANYLTQLGYPDATDQGFRVIRRDLTAEEKAGNIQYDTDGIYLTVGDQKYKGYMYMKYYNITQYGYPKFHITNCKTILEQKDRGQFDNKYFWHNSNTVSIQDRTTGEDHNNVNLELCLNCRRQSMISEYNTTDGFFSLLDQQEQEDINEEIEIDMFGYVRNWQKISRAYKTDKDYTCEHCTIRMEVPYDKRYIHAHHRNGDKLNNHRANLQCLCVLCHSHSDETHIQNFQVRRMQREKISFVNKYRSLLEALGNPYINQL